MEYSTQVKSSSTVIHPVTGSFSGVAEGVRVGIGVGSTSFIVVIITVLVPASQPTVAPSPSATYLMGTYVLSYLIIAFVSIVLVIPFTNILSCPILINTFALSFVMYTSLSSAFHSTVAPKSSVTNLTGINVLPFSSIKGFASGNTTFLPSTVTLTFSFALTINMPAITGNIIATIIAVIIIFFISS